jgi:ankyrin repeat protein
MDVVRYLAALPWGRSANFKPEKLIEAAAADDVMMVEALLLAKMDVNSMDFDHRTALHLAVSNRSMKVTTFLLVAS